MASLEEYIRSAAIQRGIDPDVAVRVAKSEGGLLNPAQQSNVRKNGVREPSYGPFQLLVGGGNTGFPEGLGNDFMRTTGLDPSKPENAYKGIDFALDTASRDGWGRWYGAKAAGLSNMAGIGGRPATMPGTMMTASASPAPSTPPPVAAPTGAPIAASPSDAPPPAAKKLAGLDKAEKGIADIFSLMALQQAQQPQPQAAPVIGPTPEQSQGLLNLLRNLNGRPV